MTVSAARIAAGGSHRAPMPAQITTASCRPGRHLPHPVLLGVLLVAVVASTGCGNPTATGDIADRQVLGLALETRQLHEETVEAGRLLVEARGDEASAASRLRSLSRDARDLAARIRTQVPVAPEVRSLREAVEQVERGAERLLAFRRSGRPNLLLAGSDALQEADRELDQVARQLDAKLGEGVRQELDALRRDVPAVAGAETAARHQGRAHIALRQRLVIAMATKHAKPTGTGRRGLGAPAVVL